MKISNELNLRLSQKLVLSQNLLLSLKLIQMPLMELREKIESELLENPALELKERTKKDKDIDDLEFSLVDQNSRFEDNYQQDDYLSKSYASESSDLNRQFLEGAISVSPNLYEYLVSQLDCQNLTEKEKEIGKIIISQIDRDGFFKESLEDMFKGEDLDIARDVLEIIQLFDPPGIASKDMREALIFQIESMTRENINEVAYRIVLDHFDLLVDRKDREIMKILKINKDELKKAIEFIGQLNPFPGRELASDDIKYIVPDAYVYRKDGEIVVEMNDDILPSLTINGYLKKIADEVKKKRKISEDQRYVSNKIKDAYQFIRLVNYRNQSLFKLVLAIADNQKEFFYNGPKYLKPLSMKIVAEQLGLSESTISRLASSKYIQTEWGIHEIKYFFTTAVGKEDGGEVKSSQSIREMIKEILEKEKDKKISDQKIVEILEEKGVKIARRTVAKYRKMLNILPSHKRGI